MDQSTHQPLRQFHSVVGITSNVDTVRRRASRVRIPATPLSSHEMHMLEKVWDNFVSDSFVTSMPQMKQILLALQVPSQPLSDQVIENAFNATNGRFSHRDMVGVLEKCKTIHSKWLYKIRGKELDDDLLEAFVAVGGGEDSTGEVDVAKMKSVVSEFQLQVDLDKIIADMDQDGNADIDFGEFAQLLREKKGKVEASPRANDEDETMVDDSAGGIGEGAMDTTPLDVCLSTMIQLKDEEDLLLGMGRTPGAGRTPAETTFVGEKSFSMHGEASRRRRGSIRNEHGMSTSRRSSDGGNDHHHTNRHQSVAPTSATTTAAANPTSTAFYKGGGGLRSLSPQRRPARRVGGTTRSPSPAGKAKPQKKHKFAL